jgi:hypothetical protein
MQAQTGQFACQGCSNQISVRSSAAHSVNLHRCIILRDWPKVRGKGAERVQLGVENEADGMRNAEVRDSGFYDLCAGANEERIAKVCIWRRILTLKAGRWSRILYFAQAQLT